MNISKTSNNHAGPKPYFYPRGLWRENSHTRHYFMNGNEISLCGSIKLEDTNLVHFSSMPFCGKCAKLRGRWK